MRNLILLLLSLFLLAGCGSVELKGQANILESTLRGFGNTLRWGDVNEAYTFLKPGTAAASTPQADLSGIQVTEYRALQPPLETGPLQVVAKVRIRYVRRESQVEKVIIDEQLWEFDEEKRVWYRTNPLPAFD